MNVIPNGFFIFIIKGLQIKDNFNETLKLNNCVIKIEGHFCVCLRKLCTEIESTQTAKNIIESHEYKIN